MKLRTLIFWPHLVAGVLAGAIILLMSITGVLLTYERQMIAWGDRAFRSAPPAPESPRLSVDVFLERWRTEHPDLAPTAVTIGADPDAPLTLAVPQRTVYADAYSGVLLGEGAQTMRRFMSGMRSWHRWLAVEGEGRPFARAITGWANLLFAFIVASGLYLWLPRTWGWRQVKAITLFNGKASGKARDFNWHNVIGFWTAVPLFIVVVSAVPISFPWANAFVYRAVGEDPPAGRGGGPGGAAGRQGGSGREGRPARDAGREGARGEAAGRREGGRGEGATGQDGPRRGPRGRASDAPQSAAAPATAEPSTTAAEALPLNELLARAERHVPGWQTINLRLPDSPDAPIVFAIDRGDGGQPHLRSTLTLDGRSGEVVRYEAFTDLTLGRRIRNVMRFAHTGEVLGIPGQTVAGLVSAGGVVLVWTGIALACRRFLAWRKRRATARGVPVDTARSSAA